MTCLEKLKLDHPQYIRDDAPGGALGCPWMYGYLPEPKKCDDCDACWSREIPGTKNIEKEKVMTCREKLALEHPEKVDSTWCGGAFGCPYDYGYLVKPYGCTNGTDDVMCTVCWDREIPGTENIEKEKENMSTKVPVGKMTKSQMLEEIERANKRIHEVETELKNLEKYKQYEEAADELKAMHTALMNSGFTNEQAFDLLKTTMQSMMPTILRGMHL